MIKETGKLYEKEINQKKKVLESKKKAAMKAPPKSESDDFFGVEELKGTESKPIAAGGGDDGVGKRGFTIVFRGF